MIPTSTQKGVEGGEGIPLSDRSGMEDKKGKKIGGGLALGNGKIDDFECKEELNYKRTPR